MKKPELKNNNIVLSVFVCYVSFLTLAALPVYAGLTNLFNTGVGASGLPLPDGTIGDLHFTLTSVPSGSTSMTRIRTSSGGYPIGPWVGDDAKSDWIGPNNDNSDDGPNGQYDYRTTFVITGADPKTAMITGQYAEDDQCDGIYLKGIWLPLHLVALHSGLHSRSRLLQILCMEPTRWILWWKILVAVQRACAWK